MVTYAFYPSPFGLLKIGTADGKGNNYYNKNTLIMINSERVY